MKVTSQAEESFATHQFPCTSEGFLADHGDVELDLPDGSVTLASVFEGFPEEEFRTEEDARFAVYAALGEEAIGRKGYSDRDPSCIGEAGHDRVSL
ncbi:MAG: DUF2795 domain-containing protein [Salinirussus sp.]